MTEPRVYLAGLAVAFAVAWGVGVALGPYDTGDSAQYLAQADNLAAGRPPYAGDWSAPRDSSRFSLRPPGYAAVLLAVRAASRAPWWLAAWQSALGVATWWAVWQTLAAVGAPRHAGALWLGLAATPATLIYAQTAMADTLFTALVAAAVLAVGRVRPERAGAGRSWRPTRWSPSRSGSSRSWSTSGPARWRSRRGHCGGVGDGGWAWPPRRRPRSSRWRRWRSWP